MTAETMMPKPVNSDHTYNRNVLGGDGLRGPDKQQSALRDVDSSKGERGAPSHGPSQSAENLPEGLKRERKGPYDKNVKNVGR
jgi:hypothetical protein